MAKAQLDQSAIETLRGEVRGGLVLPGDGEYEDSRALYNAMIDKRPAVIARCTDAADVIAAVNFGREQNLDIAIRGGGHNGGGLGSVDDGLVIDLSGMRGVWVNPREPHRGRRGREPARRRRPRDARVRPRGAGRHHLDDGSRWARARRWCRPPDPQVRPHHRQLPRGRHGPRGWKLRDGQRRRQRGSVLGRARRWRQLRRRHVVHAATPRRVQCVGRPDAVASRANRGRACVLPRLHRDRARGPQRLLRVPDRPTRAAFPGGAASPEDVRHRVVLRGPAGPARRVARPGSRTGRGRARRRDGAAVPDVEQRVRCPLPEGLPVVLACRLRPRRAARRDQAACRVRRRTAQHALDDAPLSR